MMGLLNFKCFFIVILLAIAGWNFPVGIFVDIGIVLAYVFVKRKKIMGPGIGAKGQAMQPVGDTTTGDLVKLMAMSMLGKNGDTQLAAKLATGTPKEPKPRSASERSFRRQLVN